MQKPAPTGRKETDAAVGATIRLRRKSLRISQGALALRAGVSFEQIQKYERGANRISAPMLLKIAHALEWRIVDIFASIPVGIRPIAKTGMGSDAPGTWS